MTLNASQWTAVLFSSYCLLFSSIIEWYGNNSENGSEIIQSYQFGWICDYKRTIGHHHCAHTVVIVDLHALADDHHRVEGHAEAAMECEHHNWDEQNHPQDDESSV